MIDAALQAVLDALPGARLVGGCVRDRRAGLAVQDIDLATPDPPERVVERLAEAGLRVVLTGLDHGTVTAISGGQSFEITTLRRDIRTDGRHAEVAWTDDWREDAARRDFTINAMSMDRNGQLFDYFGGEADLAAGRVRFVGDPAARIAEDHLRILRYFRFVARYGLGEPDPAAIAAIEAGRDGLAKLSVERVWSELSRLLATPDPRRTLASMQATGVLAAILPEGTRPAALSAMIAAGAPADPILRLAALLDGDATERLRLSGADRERFLQLRDPPVPKPDDSPAAHRRALAETPAELLIGRTWLAGGAGPAWDRLRADLGAMPRPVFALEGRDALVLGASPGPAVGQALREVRQQWLESGCTLDRAACITRLRAALQAEGAVSRD